MGEVKLLRGGFGEIMRSFRNNAAKTVMYTSGGVLSQNF